MSCGIGRRRGSDLALLCLRHRLAAAAPIQSLSWELSCAGGAALKKKMSLENLLKEANVFTGIRVCTASTSEGP